MASTAVEQIPIRSGTSSPLPFGRSRDAACPVCLDLDYNLFQNTVDSTRQEGRAYWRESRNHRASLKNIHGSAKAGCRLCAILRQGVFLCWGEDIFANKGYKREKNADTEEGRKIEKPKNTHGKTWLKTPTIIGLELTPGKPLALYVAKYRSCAFDLFHNRIEFHTIVNVSPVHPAFICAPSVPSHLDLNRCATTLEDWLRACNKHHISCLAPLPRLPRRLVYFSDHDIRLVETKGLSYARYTTLSHCWGQGTHMIKTTRGNVKQHMSNINWKELNQIFKDAIAITKRIGCQWIWIDCLCIIQDDELDWKEESSKMADVYSNSFLNVAATFSATSTGSCFSDRKFYYSDQDDLEPRNRTWSTEIIDDGHRPSMGLCVGFSHRLSHQHITGDTIQLRRQASPLLARAWVFQERLLAPRTLHFGSSEMMWECNSCLACECGGISETQTPTRGLKTAFAHVCQNRAPHEEILDLWRNMVEAYTSLSLTQLSDTPNAIAGLASRISSKLDSDYLAGIWAEDLPQGLLWRVNGNRQTGCERRHSLAINQPIPTWSWMSLYCATHSGAKVSYLYSKNFDQDHRLSVQWCPSVTVSADTNPFGDVPLGHLEITTAAVSGIIKATITSGDFLVIDKDGSDYTLFPDCPADEGVVDGMEVMCMLFGTTERELQIVLVLKWSMESGCYTRLGLAFWRGSVFQHAEVKTVVVR